MERLELYAYTTETDLEKGYIKVGHTLVGRHEERIKEQFGTSNSRPPIWKLIGELPEGTRDSDIHNILLKNGCKKPKDSPGKEWFIVPNSKNPFEIVEIAYNQLKYGSPRPKKYSLRKEQVGAIDKASKWFKKEYEPEVIGSATHPNRFLINAKMRFGKCFTSIHLAKKINAQNTLIVTYKPDVISEWIETVNEQVDFDGWTGIRAKYKADRSSDPHLTDSGDFPRISGPIVLCVSLQDLDIDKEGNTKDRLHKILEIEWDLVIFDEVHYGSRTERAKGILDKVVGAKTHRLDLSGTPFRLIEQDDFSSQQVYTYSYLDEMQNKKEERETDPENKIEKVYRLMPDLNISAIEITDDDIKEQRDTFETDDLDFSLNCLFETNEEGNFIYEDAVDHFIDGLTRSDHQARSISVYGKLASQLGCPPKRHTVWWLNRVDSISALIEKLNQHPYFSNFILINASGNDGKKEENDKVYATEKSKVQDAINDANSSSKFGTITFTCGRFLTGVTIREWDSILILNDTQSAESYYQAIFRVQSAWVSDDLQVLKPKAWVFDFAITRCLQVTYDCASNIADQISQQESYEGNVDVNKDNLEIVTEGLCSTLEIKRFYEGSLTSTPTTAKDIFEVLNHEGSRIALARRITSNVLVNFGKLKLLEEHPNILDILAKVKGYRSGEFSGTVDDFIQIGRDAKDLEDKKTDPNATQEDKEKAIDEFEKKDEDKERQTRKKWYATQIKRLAICMADFIYMTYQREYNIDDVIQSKSPEFFEIMTGISKEDFVLLCDKGFMNRFALNRIVREFHDQENTSLKPEEYIFENLKKMAA